jgi:hypothetical protein
MVEAEGYEPWRRRVRVHLGQNKVLQVKLRETAQRESARRKGYYALGAAAVFAVAGGVFTVLEKGALEEAQDIWDVETVRPLTEEGISPIPVRTREEMNDASDRGKRYQLLAGVSFGLAAAALGASIYFFMQERPVEREGFDLPLAVTPILPTGSDVAGVGAQVTYTRALDW